MSYAEEAWIFDDAIAYESAGDRIAQVPERSRIFYPKCSLRYIFVENAVLSLNLMRAGFLCARKPLEPAFCFTSFSLSIIPEEYSQPLPYNLLRPGEHDPRNRTLRASLSDDADRASVYRSR